MCANRLKNKGKNLITLMGLTKKPRMKMLHLQNAVEDHLLKLKKEVALASLTIPTSASSLTFCLVKKIYIS